MADHHISVQIAMARDWAGICQRKATEWTGTPEGAEYLAHSKRYTAMADALHRLAAPPAPQAMPPVTLPPLPPVEPGMCLVCDIQDYAEAYARAAIAADRARRGG